MATLTYVYARSLAVVGPLSPSDEPHSWDLCEGHAARITAPRNWELVREGTETEDSADPAPAVPGEESVEFGLDADEQDEFDSVAAAAPQSPGDDGERVLDALPEKTKAGPEPSVGRLMADLSRGAGPVLVDAGTLSPGSVITRRSHLRVLPDPVDDTYR